MSGFRPWIPDKGGALPSTLKICQRTATLDTLRVAIGFTAGQLQIIDMATQDDNKRSLQKINDERSIGPDLIRESNKDSYVMNHNGSHVNCILRF